MEGEYLEGMKCLSLGCRLSKSANNGENPALFSAGRKTKTWQMYLVKNPSFCELGPNKKQTKQMPIRLRESLYSSADPKL